jgi:hypothetical protein
LRNNWIAKAGAAALVVGIAGAASAQSNGPTGVSVRLGVFLPTTSSVGSTWFGGGIDYKLNSLSAAVPPPSTGYGYFGISADYYTYAGNSNIPVVLNYNWRMQNLVFALGAGIEFYDVPSFSSGSGTGFDAQASATYDFGHSSNPFFLQAKYFLASRDELRGFGLYAGLRF